MNRKKTLVLLWPEAALLLALLGWLLYYPFSMELAPFLARAYLREYAAHPVYAAVYILFFALARFAWRKLRSLDTFFLTLLSAFLLGPGGYYIMVMSSVRR
jgi:hypothetical protein